MDFAFVLNYIQNQFSGQLVLYVDDMAKLLGKSDKAIAELIARDTLPFKVKTVGRQRCVDIFQVAQWMSSYEDQSMESVSAKSKASPSKLKPRPGRAAQVQAPGPSIVAPGLTGHAAAKLLKMRHSQATDLGRFVYELESQEEMAFMNEVMEKLFY